MLTCTAIQLAREKMPSTVSLVALLMEVHDPLLINFGIRYEIQIRIHFPNR